MKVDINTLIEQLNEEFEDSLNVPLKQDTSFKELEDWSSMNVLILIALVDNHYDLILYPEDLQNCNTIEDLRQLIESKTA